MSDIGRFTPSCRSPVHASAGPSDRSYARIDGFRFAVSAELLVAPSSCCDCSGPKDSQSTLDLAWLPVTEPPSLEGPSLKSKAVQ